MEISVIIPIFNEEDNIRLLHERLVNTVSAISNEYELIFVNDGSKDKSLIIIKELAAKFPQVKYIDFSKNFGHQIAVFAGLEHAKGKAIVIIDADLQDPPELIRDLYNKLQQGYDVVIILVMHRAASENVHN